MKITGIYGVDKECIMEIEKTGVLEKMKSWFKWDAIHQKLNLSKDTFIEIGLYLGAGFLAGFLLKKYAHIIFLLTFFVVGIVILQQYDVLSLSINWDKAESVLGIHRTTISTSTLHMIWDWMKLNLFIVISFVVGFMFGFKLG